MLDWIADFWPVVVSAVAVALAMWTAAHAIMYRRDARAALLWVGLVVFTPFVGPILYLLLGINRVRRKALRLREGTRRVLVEPSAPPVAPDELPIHLPPESAHLAWLQRIVDHVADRPLVPGNLIEPLVDGDEAYPAMLAAIAAAERSVSLATYIFDTDPVGVSFVEHLADAVGRGVAVRVLLDDAGSRYSWPRITHSLRRAGVPHDSFHTRSWIPWGGLNLRNHRKVCVVDGHTGFTGGINIRRRHVRADPGRHAVQDLHFRVQGPVVAGLQEVFAEDWAFTSDEELTGEDWFPALSTAGPSLARAIADGPDEELDRLRLGLLGALGIARHSVRIVTPYFLPDASLVNALDVAAMRGVEVDIIIPERSNIFLVQWAMRATLWQVLQHGCRVWLSPPPFDHTKLLLVDDCWTLLGSTNWDARSLRLNFELDVEAYDPGLATRLGAIVERKRAASRPLTLAEVDARSIPVRLRDGIARLFSPVL